MTTLAVASKAASAPKRFAPVSRTLKEITPKIDTEDIIRNWKPKTGIIQKIKNAKLPFNETITKDMALDLLTLNIDHNRNLTWKKINKFVTLLQAGKWKHNNGDVIRLAYFPKTGADKLIDGQNRLWASWIADVPLQTLIAAKLDPSVIPTIDIGETRTAAHMATINGFKTNANQLAYAIKNVLLYKKLGQIKGNVSPNDVQNIEVDEFFNEQPKDVELINDYIIHAKDTWMRSTKDFFTAPQWATAYYILQSQPGMAKQASIFMDQFASGADLRANNPIKKARTHFETEFKYLHLGQQRKKVDMHKLTIKFNVLFTAWNHYISHETPSDIRIDAKQRQVVKPNWRIL